MSPIFYSTRDLRIGQACRPCVVSCIFVIVDNRNHPCTRPSLIVCGVLVIFCKGLYTYDLFEWGYIRMRSIYVTYHLGLYTYVIYICHGIDSIRSFLMTAIIITWLVRTYLDLIQPLLQQRHRLDHITSLSIPSSLSTPSSCPLCVSYRRLLLCLIIICNNAWHPQLFALSQSEIIASSIDSEVQQKFILKSLASDWYKWVPISCR